MEADFDVFGAGRPELGLQKLFHRLGVLNRAIKFDTELTAVPGFVIPGDGNLLLGIRDGSDQTQQLETIAGKSGETAPGLYKKWKLTRGELTKHVLP